MMSTQSFSFCYNPGHQNNGLQEPLHLHLHRLQLLPPFQHQLQRKQMLLLLLSQQQPQQFRQFPKTHYRQPLHSRRLL